MYSDMILLAGSHAQSQRSYFVGLGDLSGVLAPDWGAFFDALGSPFLLRKHYLS